jgi:hypothetical protein
MSEVKPESKSNMLAKYFAFVFVATVLIGVFSLIMAGIASFRNDVAAINYQNTALIYQGPLEQSAPSLKALDTQSDYYIQNRLTPEIIKRYADNTFLRSTDARVIINADFVKKGLDYQPSYRTQFNADYVLKNNLNEKSAIAFVFPFPFDSQNAEISNATLSVNGVAVDNAKTKIDLSQQYGYAYNTDGLSWSGEIAPHSEISVSVSYKTVGLSLFTYRGIENSKGAQDFKFSLDINGTRAYNVNEGLSVDSREFGTNSVSLKWDKTELFSAPLINVSVGEKLNPSAQVSRIYLTMSPLYLVFIITLIFLAYKFAKPLKMFDLFLVTVLFVMFFPFVHYLSSFTIDPTMEIFSGIANIHDFSMPLYTAFAIAWGVIGGLMAYLVARMTSLKFTLKMLLPTLVLFLGFFPLVVTIPEYAMLLVIIGFIALMAIVVQVRIRLEHA